MQLTGNFVASYSIYSAQHAQAGLPNPATFRANALQNLKSLDDGQELFSTAVVGLPGREIASIAEDPQMKGMLKHLEDNPNEKNISKLLDINGVATHRSVWAFTATQQACADCHNKMQNLHDADKWKVGDLMGAQVVEQNITARLNNIDLTARVQSILLFIAFLAAWFCCLYLAIQYRLNNKLKTLATTDPLTGCINRRELYDRIDKLKGVTDGAVLMLDLDNFKSINDTYGHDVGDKVLKDFSTHIRDRLRKDDWVARVGGEEFVVWLPNVKAIDAIQMAERLLLSAAQSNVSIEATSINYTVSIGLHIVQDSTPTLFGAWLKAADALLYRAKNEGRNRIICEVSSAA